MDTLQTIFALIWIDGLQLSHKKCLEALWKSRCRLTPFGEKM